MKGLCTVALAVGLLTAGWKPASAQLEYLTWSAQDASARGQVSRLGLSRKVPLNQSAHTMVPSLRH